jgi:hypothetical protein
MTKEAEEVPLSRLQRQLVIQSTPLYNKTYMTKEAEEVPLSRLQTISHSEFSSIQLDIYDQGG